ncbi:TetR family transcriptional regulator [Streptomyces griseoviridis]|uniref:TetR family transcriptional regulator n=1 Tax=Streptomyces griseoviridis TaxID=45398 RepID=A0A3S9ZIK3_STRGD|nr:MULTISPECIES: TetR family transcriptional regulator [Streptomyces]AZS87538.1 TetR family transcriptional regulator [Streptomyces griseoviridis]MDH6701821.1 AcrR family transcriptional regulator [Streptomyces sp. MAA16]QCN85618.1 TetR family transcriptional regulator [Streptomyces griseoviridis]
METLRERKKQRTRDALLRTAVEMFVERGYDGTTVDDIADAVDVSPRTFFRYFAGKEEAALALEELAVARYLGAVRARPAAEAPMVALRRAVLESWDTLHEVIESVVPVEAFVGMHRVIESTPVLLAAHLRRNAETEETIARMLAEREGLDVDTDPRPRLAVAVFGGVMRVTEQRWSASGDFSLEGMRALTIAYLDQVGPALAGNWRAR